MKNLVRIGVAGVALAFAGGLLAEDKPGQVVFSIVDQNHDGKVSKTEAQASTELTSQFATLDADRDSYLSQSEFGKLKSSGSAPVAPTPGAAPDSAKPPMSADPSSRSPAPQSSSESAQPAGEAR